MVRSFHLTTFLKRSTRLFQICPTRSIHVYCGNDEQAFASCVITNEGPNFCRPRNTFLFFSFWLVFTIQKCSVRRCPPAPVVAAVVPTILIAVLRSVSKYVARLPFFLVRLNCPNWQSDASYHRYLK